MSADNSRTAKADVEVKGHNGAPIPMRTLFYDQTSEREVHIVCSLDRMSVYMKLAPGQHFSGISRETIVDLIRNAGVTCGLIEPGITLFTGLQNSPNPMPGYCQVARGEFMRQGGNGSIEFYVQPTSMEPRYDETDTGNIDYKQLNLIENCFAGQRVASILPPGPGRPGRDVFGGEIPPEAGAPVAVQPGPGIVVSANGRDFTSEIEGRLVYEDGVLSVSPSLEINHDIDYSVGNVDFVGKVVVKGSLLDGFYINAKNGVEVHGDMGAARISSGGDVKITGGVKGKGAAIITCRNLVAHYIDDTVVEASGDVSATKEILNSDVKSLGRVSVSSGTVIGGVICGFQGVDAGTLGSEMGIATAIAAGVNWTEENKKEEIRAQVAEYMDRLHSAKVLLDPLFADESMTARLGSEHKSMLSELISELRDIRENLVELLQERAEITEHRQEGMVNQVNVAKTAYMGVTVRFSAVDGEVKDTAKGPLSITQDEAAGSIRFGTLVSLPSREQGGEAGEKADEA